MKVCYLLRAAVLLGAFALALGCQKETVIPQPGSTAELKTSKAMPVTRAYRDSFDVVLTLKPDVGWTWKDPDAPAWYPGEGTGNATHMGNANIYFNTHTLRVNGTVTVFAAPVGMFYATQVKQFNITPTDDISVVTYDDDKENSVWFRLKEKEGIPSRHLDATNIAMDAELLIVGGTGKFEGATGETVFHATFDQKSFDKEHMTFTTASMWQKGWIRY